MFRINLRHCTRLFIVLAAMTAGARANGYGTDSPYQLPTPADLANLGAVESIILQKQGGMYHAPAYNSYSTTNIAKQTNCNVAPTTYGNSGTTAATAGSPSTIGATPSATGNSSSTQSSLTSSTAGTPLTTTGQTNSGAVGTVLNGSTSTSIAGTYSQALNSNQTNGGTQSASVSNSAACSVGSGSLN